MGFTLDHIVPWGRSLEEYTAMFALTEADLTRRILGCADGPASFNAELTARGGCVLSVDPIYEFSAAQIEERIKETYGTLLSQLRQNMDAYVWTTFHSAEQVGETRRAAMRLFLKDYEAGRSAGRYLAAELPHLPLENAAFDLALCSHCLFLYSEVLSQEFHIESLLELCRVACEVRVFPILNLDGTPSPHLQPVLAELVRKGLRATVEKVDYEFQRGGNQMLKILV